MGKRGPTLSEKEAHEVAIRKAEKKAKKAAQRAIAREAKAKGISPKESEGWSKGVQKGEYGQDIFDGKVHAKWPALFKKHLGYLEAHIKALDRVMQDMKSEMDRMTGEQRRQFELNENSRWRTMCGLIDRARETLVAARFASRTIIPPSWQKDKSGLGVKGLKFEPLLPNLQAKAEAEGIFWNDNKLDRLWGVPMKQKAEASGPSADSESEDDDEDEDSDSDDSEPSSSEEDVEEGEPKDVESNPYFVIDTEPTPVNINGLTPKKSKKEEKSKKEKGADPSSADPTPAKKSKKRSSEEETEEPSSAKKSKSATVDPSSFDFTAVEAQLHAEVEAGLKAKQKEEQERTAMEDEQKQKGGKIKLTRKEKSKRKRESDGIQAIIDSFKKKQRLEFGYVEKATEAAAATSGEAGVKDGRKSKKRKAEKYGDEGKSKKLRAE